MLERGLQKLLIAAADALKPALEFALPIYQGVAGLGGPVFVPAHDEHDHGRDKGAGEQIGRQHSEADGFRQGHKEKPGDSGKQEHRHKHDANTQRRDESGHGNLLRAVENRLLHFLAQGEVALDVFDFHGGVVDENSDGESQTSEGHDVDGLAERAEQKHRDTDRKRDRDSNDDGGAPVAEEEQDHRGRESGCDQAFAHDSLNGSSHEQRLIEESFDGELRAEVGRQRLRRLLRRPPSRR